MRHGFRGPTTRASAALAAGAVTLFGWTLARAIRANTWLSMHTSASKAGDVIAVRSRDTSSDELIARAAGRDPFSTIGSTKPESLVVEEPPASRDALRVLGTVVDAEGGSFVLCQLGAAQPVLLRIGETIGDYELRSVNKGTAVFKLAGGGRVELLVSRAGV